MIEEKGFLMELRALFLKSMPYASAILFGLIGKVGMEMMMKKKYSIWQWIGIALVSVYFGYITAVMCEYNEWNTLKLWLPSLSTLFGQQIALYFVYNGKSILDRLVNSFFRRK